ncbi:MAG: type II toxin-antitoxin system Phd/YefM family antitoxin [Opitutaceae bacterium]|nr:type II toxin-antitoxin system Phd/YefM family antitoxin [Opitutaceae bacterium]
MVKTRTVTVLEIKTRLGAYLNGVERDQEEILITRHDKPVARLVPVQRTAVRADALRRLAAIPTRRKTDTLTTKDLVTQGRK